MPSAPSMRARTEIVLRGVALLALAALLWRHLPRGESTTGDGAPLRIAVTAPEVADSTGRAMATRLLQQVVRGEAAPLQLVLPAIPTIASRGAAAALRASGRDVRWTDSTGARGLAIGAARTADRDGRVVLSAAARNSSALVLADAGGTLDSLVTRAPTTSLLVRASGDGALAYTRVASSEASVALASGSAPRRILVYGRPGWESKFTIAALEEAGWAVDASLPVSPRASVTVGAPMVPDTARYAVVIVLDSALARAAALSRYVRDGGGVVISGDALQDRALAALMPARVRATRAEVPGGLLSPAPLSGLEAFELAAHADAVVLQRDADGDAGTVALRRGAGRVVASAYRETWRWRMEGAADGVDAHRRWWTGLVRAAGYVPSDTTSATAGDPAPYADLVARLGAPVAAGTARVQRAGNPSSRLTDVALLTLALASLVAEWASRRLRGAQ